MKICVISTPVFRFGLSGTFGYSGLEHLAWQIANGLAGLGHEVSLVAPDGSICPGVTIISIGPEKSVDEFNAYNRYSQHLTSVDVVIDHTWQKWSYMMKQEGKLKVPVLGVLHAPINTMYQSLPPGVDKPCFVCISKDQAAHFEAFHGREARVAYNGVDSSIYRSMGFKRNNRFLFLARFSTIKGPDLAIEACLSAGVGLDLIGDTSITNEPEFFDKCKALAEKQSHNWDSSKGKQIQIIGGISRGETVAWFSRAYCMIHPNQRFREPLGLAPLESMLCGCPVIAWKYGAMKETVSESSGWLVGSMEELKNKVTTVANMNLDDMRKTSREWAINFSVDRMVQRYEELCQESLSGGW